MSYTVAAAELFPSYSPEQVAAHRRRWVDALRSGRYAQGFERLRRYAAGIADATIDVVPGQFCCLGVAEDQRGCSWTFLRQDAAWMTDAPMDDVDAGGDGSGDNSTCLSLPTQAWLGLARNQSDPVVPASLDDRWELVPLSVLNDDYRLGDQANQARSWSFDRIADLVEQLPLAWDGTDEWCQAYLRDVHGETPWQGDE